MVLQQVMQSRSLFFVVVSFLQMFMLTIFTKMAKAEYNICMIYFSLKGEILHPLKAEYF